MMTGGPGQQDAPIRIRWQLLIGVLLLFPLAALVLLVIPQPWASLLLFGLVIMCLALLRRLVLRSRQETRK
jgi:uncharacterized membrane protein YccC